MARTVIAAVGILLGLSSAPCEAGFYSGNKLVGFCMSDMTPIYGYVAQLRATAHKAEVRDYSE